MPVAQHNWGSPTLHAEKTISHFKYRGLVAIYGVGAHAQYIELRPLSLSAANGWCVSRVKLHSSVVNVDRPDAQWPWNYRQWLV